MLLPSALEFSSHPPVSVYGTGSWKTIAAFLGSRFSDFPTYSSVHIMDSYLQGGFASLATFPFVPSIPYLVHLYACVPTVLFPQGTGISTCCPSTTTFVLALGPDLPRADQLYSGNLGYSAGKILTSLSLLIPAFSLLKSPLLLTVQLLRFKNAPLPKSSYDDFPQFR